MVLAILALIGGSIGLAIMLATSPRRPRIFAHGQHHAPRHAAPETTPEPARPPVEEVDTFWAVDGLLRAKYPHLFAGDDDYWGRQWRDFYIKSAQIAADETRHRRELGLEPMTLVDFMPAVAA